VIGRAGNFDVKPVGFDRTNEHSRRTTEIAEVHRPPSSLSDVNTSAASVNHTGQNDDTSIASDGHATVNDPELELDCNNNGDDVGFPSPPTSMLDVFSAAGQHRYATEVDSVSETVCTSSEVLDQNSNAHFPPVPNEELNNVSTADDQHGSASNCDTVSRSVSEAEFADQSVPVMVSAEAAELPVPPNETSLPPPPPPAPPLPTSFDVLVPFRSSGTPKQPGSAVPKPSAQSQRELEESRRRDESHAALMAAVALRRSLLESTDAEQLAQSIESRVQRSNKIQMVFRAGRGVSQNRALSAAPSHLAPAVEPGLPTRAENG